MMDDFTPGSYNKPQSPECWLCNNTHLQRMLHGKTIATGSFSWFLKFSTWETIHQREKKKLETRSFLEMRMSWVNDKYVYRKTAKEGGSGNLQSRGRALSRKEEMHGCDGCTWPWESCAQMAVGKSWGTTMSQRAEFMNLNETRPLGVKSQLKTGNWRW